MKILLESITNLKPEDSDDMIYTDQMDLPALVICDGKKEIVMDCDQYGEPIIIVIEEGRKIRATEKIGYRKDITLWMPITIDEITVKYSDRE